MNKSIFNIHVFLVEAFKKIDIDMDDYFTIDNCLEYVHIFDNVKDFRQSFKSKYKLSNVLLLCFLSVVREGKISCTGMYDHIFVYRKQYEEMGLIENGHIPSHDTIRRILISIDPYEFENIVISQIECILQKIRKFGLGNQFIHQSLDGKEIRGSGRREDTKNPLRNVNILNYYDNSLGLCIHSEPVDGKTNEIPVAQKILEPLRLNKTVITFDALHTQTATCDLISKRRGYYVAPVKENQKGLFNEIRARFEKSKRVKPIERDKRVFRFIKLPANYDDCGFTGMKTFVEMISYTRKNSITMYFISNSFNKDLIMEAIENRWEIENGLHKEKDTYLNEDSVRFTNKTALTNVAIMNNLAICLAKLYGSISTIEMRTSKREFRAFPLECIAKTMKIMNDKEIMKQLKQSAKAKK